MFTDLLPLDLLLRAALLSAVTLFWVIVVVRVIGLRSFSKMTPVDFVTTLAVGSLLAGAAQADAWPKFWQPVLAIAALLTLQALFARARERSGWLREASQNTPVLLMRNGAFIPDAMRAHRVVQTDIMAKLRGANVADLAQVHAVILETTGDISVLHGPNGMEEVLLADVGGTSR
jgi:uncharacterized membrane protein YcaP (DUF421 family)